VHDPGSRHDGRLASDLSPSADEVTCLEFVELVTDYFEGVLPPRALGLVEEHLVMCDWCVRYVEQMRATIDSLQMLKGPASREPPDTLLAALRARKAAGE
jgi:predicted anti-sigma-YlaC factor YlaD